MVKYSHDLRLELVLKVESGASLRSTAKESGVSKNVLRQWVRHYQSDGLEGLFSTKQRYTANFKQYAVEYRWQKGLSYSQAVSELGIPNSATLFAWEKIFLEMGPEGLQDTRKGRPPTVPKKKKDTQPKTREQELEAKIAHLEMENAYLKKLNALVAEREKSEKKISSESSQN